MTSVIPDDFEPCQSDIKTVNAVDLVAEMAMRMRMAEKWNEQANETIENLRARVKELNEDRWARDERVRDLGNELADLRRSQDDQLVKGRDYDYLEDRYNKLVQWVFANCEDAVWNHVDSFLNQKEKIKAIKAYRMLTNLGLKDAKEAVDARILNHYPNWNKKEED